MSASEIANPDALSYMGRERFHSVGEMTAVLHRIGFGTGSVMHRGEFRSPRTREQRKITGTPRLSSRLETSPSVIRTKCLIAR